MYTMDVKDFVSRMKTSGEQREVNLPRLRVTWYLLQL